MFSVHFSDFLWCKSNTIVSKVATNFSGFELYPNETNMREMGPYYCKNVKV